MPDLARPGTGLRREAGCAWETQELTDEHVTVRLVVLPPEGTKLPETRVKLWVNFCGMRELGSREVGEEIWMMLLSIEWRSVIISMNGFSCMFLFILFLSFLLLFAQKLGNSLQSDGTARQHQEA